MQGLGRCPAIARAIKNAAERRSKTCRDRIFRRGRSDRVFLPIRTMDQTHYARVPSFGVFRVRLLRRFRGESADRRLPITARKIPEPNRALNIPVDSEPSK